MFVSFCLRSNMFPAPVASELGEFGGYWELKADAPAFQFTILNCEHQK